MPDETKHGNPTPSGQDRAGRGPQIECAEFEALLSDALDGDLMDKDGRMSAARQESFEAHRRVCAVCGPLFEDVQAGHRWLRALEEVEPPAHLVHNILAATSGARGRRLRGPTAERLRSASGCGSGGIRSSRLWQPLCGSRGL